MGNNPEWIKNIDPDKWLGEIRGYPKEQCNGIYESALHSDCEICEVEDCHFRKGQVNIPFLIIFTIVMIIGGILMVWGISTFIDLILRLT